MKINLLGTLGVIGAVVSLTAACTGSPTKPTAINSLTGDGGSASSVNFSNPRLAEAGLEVCADQPPATTDENGEVTAAPVMMCDVSTTDAPADDAVISEPSASDAILSLRRLHR